MDETATTVGSAERMPGTVGGLLTLQGGEADVTDVKYIFLVLSSGGYVAH